MNERKILKSKHYLYLTEFFAGMAIMAVELGASRLLAPYFSSSQIVWTIIIGTIMIAMALGNIWGGRSADKDPNPDRLYKRLMIASLWIAAIPVIGKYIIIGISGVLIIAVDTKFLIWAGFLACIALFVFPLFILGTVTPSLVKYTVESLDNNGKTVGMLGAFNTIGSILGTFLPTFVTIPAVGTSISFLLFSGILFLLTLIYFISEKVKKGFCIVSLVLFILFCVLGNSNSFAFWENKLLYEGESVYNYLQVKETDDSVILSTNVLFGVQSIMMKNDELTGMYYDYALAAPLMAGIGAEDSEEDPSMLILGMGSGTYATQCQKYYDNMSIEGVEIDQKITDLAQEYFEMPDDISVCTYDGRAFLNVSDKKYDVIMVDAYQDITIPFQMSSLEFFDLVREHLKDDGVMVVNMNMHDESEGNINAHISDTIAEVFPYVYTVDVVRNTNRELFASASKDICENLENNIAGLEDTKLRNMMLKVANNLVEYEQGEYLLTDDKAPVELLGMNAIDGIIKSQLGYYRKVFKEEGVQGLLSFI